MKAAKVILMIGAVLVVVVVILGVAGLYFANRYVQSPAFKEQLLTTAHQELGADVRVDELQVSLFSGATLRGVTISNPTNFTGNLLTADSFVLRYRLLPLLQRRVEIEQLSLDEPVITLARNDKGEWNYEAVGAKEGGTKSSSTSPQPTSTPRPKSETSTPFDIVLSKLAITRGNVLMVTDKNKPLLKIDGINFSSSMNLANGKLTGTGKTGFDKVSVAEKLFVQQLAAPVAISEQDIKLAPLSGKIADGAIAGDASLELSPTFAYAVNLQVKDGDVAKLLAEAGTKQVLNGKLELTTSLKGTGGLATMAGSGRAEIKDGRLMKIPVMNLLATLLQMPDLRDLKFTECLLEFSITNNTMQTPVIRIAAPQVQITGKGVVSLEDYSLNHDLTIAFAKGMLDRAPKEVRNLFTERQDGSLTLDFRVWGPYDAPKTDLQDRIIKGVGQQLIEKGLQKLLK
jgi:uncharacterized protein involved in outer membrane biogenesis